MKVRLKLDQSFTDLRVIRFQFHEGPIKTPKFFLLFFVLVLFQFHEGPIKTSHERENERGQPGFNSMKVRLKQVE